MGYVATPKWAYFHPSPHTYTPETPKVGYVARLQRAKITPETPKFHFLPSLLPQVGPGQPRKWDMSLTFHEGHIPPRRDKKKPLRTVP